MILLFYLAIHVYVIRFCAIYLFRDSTFRILTLFSFLPVNRIAPVNMSVNKIARATKRRARQLRINISISNDGRMSHWKLNEKSKEEKKKKNRRREERGEIWDCARASTDVSFTEAGAEIFRAYRSDWLADPLRSW